MISCLKSMFSFFTFIAFIVLNFGLVSTAADYKPKVTFIGGKIVKLQYPDYTLWMDCDKRAAYKFQYTVGRDVGRHKRINDFTFETSLPLRCQQTSNYGYGYSFDRGHLVPQNHLDNNLSAMAASNRMVNILPQAADLNRGAWLATEEMVECHRDQTPITVIGGALWSDDDKVLGRSPIKFKYHRVTQPTEYWKVLVKGEGVSRQVIAFLFPNKRGVHAEYVNDYIVSVETLEARLGYNLLSDRTNLKIVPTQAWSIPKDCDKG